MERKRARETARLEEIRNLVDVASHEFTEPMRNVKLHVQRLHRRLGDDLDEEVREEIETVVRAADKLKQVTRDFVDFSEITLRPLSEEPVDADDAAQDALADLEDLRSETDAEIEFTSDLPTVRSDPDLLRRLFLELLENAMRFHDDGTPRIELGDQGTDEERNLSVLYVRDNGPGIPKRHHERIFKLFQQLERREDGGTGVGLALCRRIVERNGGDIEVESDEGAGATFRFALPPAPDSSPADRARRAGSRSSPDHRVNPSV